MFRIVLRQTFQRALRSQITLAMFLAVVAYVLIPQIIAAREAARLTICRNRLWTCCAGYYAHTILVDDEFNIVRVESDPLYPGIDGSIDSSFLYAYFRNKHDSDELIRLQSGDLPNSTVEEAQRRTRLLRESKEFLYRQGRTVTAGGPAT